MPVYNRFSELYVHGHYTEYSTHLAESYPSLAQHFGLPMSGKLLDIACGEGTFAAHMAHQGWQVTGVDLSAEMLSFARQRSTREQVEIDFIQQDMRALVLPAHFDLATCWYDSLNYLLDIRQLAAAFQSAHNVIKPGGWYLFDMNTIPGLMSGWMRQSCYVQQDDQDYFEFHRPSCDYEHHLASVQITFFIRQRNTQGGGDLWERLEETHTERGYPLDQIQSLLLDAGFESISMLGSIREFTPPKPDSGRVWFLARRT